MKLLSLQKLPLFSSLLAVMFLTACETSQKTVDKVATNDRIETAETQYDPIAAAQKRLTLGLKYIEAGYYERAKMNLLKAEQHAPQMSDVLYAMAYYHQKVLENDKAEAYYQKAMRKSPNNPNYLNAYGAFLCTRMQQYDRAVEYFLKAVANPDYTSTAASYENAGFCSLEGQQYDKAKLYFEKALTFNKHLTRSLYGMARMEFEQGNYNRAESYLLRYEGKSKPSPDSLLLGYKIGRRLNDRLSMESYGEKLGQLFPASEQANIYRRMNR